jgi:hypothetical protein
MWRVLTDSVSGEDENDAIRLANLINPLREPFEYDNTDIGLLRGVLQLAALAGPANISTSEVNLAYGEIAALVAHIHNEHRDENGMALAPSHWFNADYLAWLNPERLLIFLPGIRGKTELGITEYLKQEWEKLERCGKCNEILALAQGEGELSGVCYKCEPSQEDPQTSNAHVVN